MKILIVGLGKVGQLLCAYLSAEGHDIVGIDPIEQKVDEVVERNDIFGICGNGANCDVLREAGVEDADVLLAVTSSDELNILSGLIAKRLGVRYTIARVRNPDYYTQLRFLREELGFNMILNPEAEAANEIVRSILFPSAMKVNTFARGRVEIAEVKVTKNNRLAGIQLSDLYQISRSNILICAIKRGEQVYIPNGQFILEQGDHAYLTGSHKELVSFCDYTHLSKKQKKKVMIIGGSKIAYFLAKQLLDQKYSVKIIEQNETRCIELAQRLPQASIIHANGSDESVLEDERVDEMDVVVTLTGIDEENMIVSLLCKNMNAKKAIAKVNNLRFTDMVDHMDIDGVISPKRIAANQILAYVRAKSNKDEDSAVRTLYKLVNEHVEALEFMATDNFRGKKTSLAVLPVKKDILVAAILRGRQVIVPKGNDQILSGDRVIVVTQRKTIRDLNDILED